MICFIKLNMYLISQRVEVEARCIKSKLVEAGRPMKQAKRDYRRSMVYPKDHAGPISNRYRTVTEVIRWRATSRERYLPRNKTTGK